MSQFACSRFMCSVSAQQVGAQVTNPKQEKQKQNIEKHIACTGRCLAVRPRDPISGLADSNDFCFGSRRIARTRMTASRANTIPLHQTPCQPKASVMATPKKKHSACAINCQEDQSPVGRPRRSGGNVTAMIVGN